MRHKYNRERTMQMVFEVSFSELRLIHALAKAVDAMETTPNGVWKDELSELATNVGVALESASKEAADHFTSFQGAIAELSELE